MMPPARKTFSTTRSVQISLAGGLPARGLISRRRVARVSLIDHSSKSRQDALQAAFLKFWGNYPRKVAKRAAWKAWLREEPKEEELPMIFAAIVASRLSDQWRQDAGRYIPHPATWINQRRWEDDRPAPAEEAQRRPDEALRCIGCFTGLRIPGGSVCKRCLWCRQCDASPVSPQYLSQRAKDGMLVCQKCL